MNLDKKHRSPMIAWLLRSAAAMLALPRTQFRQGTSSRHRGHWRSGSDLPRFYPGAKLARQAIEKRCTVKNPPVVG